MVGRCESTSLSLKSRMTLGVRKIWRWRLRKRREGVPTVELDIDAEVEPARECTDCEPDLVRVRPEVKEDCDTVDNRMEEARDERSGMVLNRFL